MQVSGIFLGGKEDTDYLFTAAQTYFPATWERFASLVPKSHRSHITAYYFEQFNKADELHSQKYLYEWMFLKEMKMAPLT